MVRRHVAGYRRLWRKVHLGLGAQTLEIRAVEVTNNAIGDAQMLPQLLAQIPENESGGAYDTRACHEALTHRYATTIIKFKRKAAFMQIQHIL